MATQPIERLVRGAVAEAANRVHIQVRNLPRTALPSDLQRLCAQFKVDNVKKVELDYRHFEPWGVGWITLSNPTFMRQAISALTGATISGIPINVYPSPPPLVTTRKRGVEGRAEAVDRGLMTGDGPTGGISGNGRNVVIAGLPGRMTAQGLKQWLKSFKLAGDTYEEKEIAKIEIPDRQFSLLSRHLIRLASVSEAHRLVRRLHHTYYEAEIYGTRYPIRARIVY